MGTRTIALPTDREERIASNNRRISRNRGLDPEIFDELRPKVRLRLRPSQKIHLSPIPFANLGEETSKGTVASNKRTFICRGISRPFTRLPDLLTISARLRSPEGRASLKALVKLYESNTEVDRPGLGLTCYCHRLSSSASSATSGYMSLRLRINTATST
ncbi:hypothetical protein BN1723_009121 [Verticillium longisporum]|uniref:Uncharacterized protein n=1 Tax=Verticillium longisporum TaxID=100787 RepID=A0A0G4KLQ7_VERLO|nr:hypothetical protein BN1723_009121 [Verticillium longisporum]CRK28071.1 hypothetical protein BN1708_015100 [Verticillium longisporum]